MGLFSVCVPQGTVAVSDDGSMGKEKKSSHLLEGPSFLVYRNLL